MHTPSQILSHTRSLTRTHSPTHTHTPSHAHSLSHAHSHHMLCLSHTHSFPTHIHSPAHTSTYTLPLTVSHTHSYTFTLSHTVPLTHAPSHAHSLSHIRSLTPHSYSYTHSHALPRTHTHNLSHTITHSPSHTPGLSHSRPRPLTRPRGWPSRQPQRGSPLSRVGPPRRAATVPNSTTARSRGRARETRGPRGPGFRSQPLPPLVGVPPSAPAGLGSESPASPATLTDVPDTRRPLSSLLVPSRPPPRSPQPLPGDPTRQVASRPRTSVPGDTPESRLRLGTWL